jgi:hypothetical protein
MNLVMVMPLPKGTTIEEMVESLRFVVSDHPALRTRLRYTAGPSGPRHPWQVIAESGKLPLQVLDIEDEDPAVVAEELRARYELTWFDYEHEFPVRMAVIRQAGVLRTMVVGYSHIMIDGAGLAVLVHELAHRDAKCGLDPLALARTQYSPAGRRQTTRCLAQPRARRTV